MKENKLVLYTFPPVPGSYSSSPFCLKTESFLRIIKVPYEKCYTSSFGKYGTSPYLRIFDGDRADTDSDDFEEISDSNQIMARFLEDPDFDTSQCKASLTREQNAIAHSCLRMLEEHTSQIGFYYRYHLHMESFCEATQLRERLFMGDTSVLGRIFFVIFKKGMVSGWGKRARQRGFTRYDSPEDVWAMSCEDIQALEDLFASNQTENYFFGQSHPGVLDCAVFGHLSQFLFIDMEFPQKIYLRERCPGLLRFMGHFKQTFFPDWEILCERKPNEALKVDSSRMQAFEPKTMLNVFCAGAIIVAIGAIVYPMLRTPSR
jgi:hypothetical protein